MKDPSTIRPVPPPGSATGTTPGTTPGTTRGLTPGLTPGPTTDPKAGAERCGPEDTLACLLATAQELHAAADLSSGLEQVARRLGASVPFDNFAVLLLDDLGRELRFAFALGYPEEVIEHWRFGLGQGVPGRVARSGETVVCEDTEADPTHPRIQESNRSEIAVPLTAKDRVIGVLVLGATEPGRLTGDHGRWLGYLGSQLASAIESQRLYESVRRQARSLSILHELSRELTTILDRRRVVERVAERLRRLIAFDVFTVMLWNESAGLLEPWVSTVGDRPQSGRIEPLPLGLGISGTAAALRQPIRVPNVHVDPRFLECDSGVTVRSEIAVPLVFENRLFGTLDLESTEYDAFRPEDEQLLATLGSSLAIALANAEMYETLRSNQERVDRDLQTARTIQRRLLPNATPWIEGLQLAVRWEPARHLGGDFYDVLPYGEGRVAIAVGDVAGKATSAALYGALCVGMLRELAYQRQPEPAELLTQMNSRLREQRIQNRFLALLFAVYDCRARTLTFSNSGIPFPHHVRSRWVGEVELGGVPLGSLPKPVYGTEVVHLLPGDVVVLASDGITEARDPSQREFGTERFKEVLLELAGRPTEEIADGLLGAVADHTRSAEASDDRTLAILRVAADC